MEDRKKAVEWLETQIKEHALIKPSLVEGFELLLIQAKEMEEDNITLAYSDGGADTIRGVYKFNNYYKETYGG